MSTLQELLQQKQELEQKIKELKAAELNKALITIRDLVNQYGITSDQVFSRASTKQVGEANAAPKIKKPVAIKYRSRDELNTWTGRGLKPLWLKGLSAAEIEQFRVKEVKAA